MPTYLYRCENGHELEKQQSMNDEPLRECEVFICLPSGNFTTGEIYERPSMKCPGLVEKLINFQGGVSVQGGTPKHYS